MTNVVFENIEANIVNQLMLAQKSIKVAVAWINSKDILGILCWKLKGSVDVVLVLQYDDINNGGRNSLDFSEYKKLGGKLYWVEEMNSTMHTKYCIIDNKILLHGSCNWTYRGFNKNVEAFNMTYDEPSLIEAYSTHFERLKEGSNSNDKSATRLMSVSSKAHRNIMLSKEERVRFFIEELKHADIDNYSNDYIKSFIEYWTFSVTQQKMRFEEKPDFLMKLEVEDWARKQGQLKEDEEYNVFCQNARNEAEIAYENYCKYIDNLFLWPDYRDRLKELNDAIESNKELKKYKIKVNKNSISAYEYIKKHHLPAIVASPNYEFGDGSLQSKIFSYDGEEPEFTYDVRPNCRKRNMYYDWEIIGEKPEFGGVLGKITKIANTPFVEFVTIPAIEDYPDKEKYVKRFIGSCIFNSRFSHKLKRRNRFLKKENMRLLFEANYAIESYNQHCRERLTKCKDISILEAYKIAEEIHKRSGKEVIKCPIEFHNKTIGDILDTKALLHPSQLWLKMYVCEDDSSSSEYIMEPDYCHITVSHQAFPSSELLYVLQFVAKYDYQSWHVDSWVSLGWWPETAYLIPDDMYYARDGFRFLSLKEACGFTTEGLQVKPLKYYSEEILSWSRENERRFIRNPSFR